MTIPKHPDTIIVKNKYYPNGLLELDVWNYYLKVKWKLIKELDNRTIFFNIATDLNQSVIRRRSKENKLFYINSKNFEEIITGRTLVIHSQMNHHEKIGIIDIDTDNFTLAARAAYDVYEFIRKGGISFVESASIRYTGKTSFHVLCNLKRKNDIDLIRQLFRFHLLQSDLAKKYTVGFRRIKGIPNLDLSSNKFSGGFISLYSLSELGLPCTEVPSEKIFKFKPENTRILTIKNRL